MEDGELWARDCALNVLADRRVARANGFEEVWSFSWIFAVRRKILRDQA